MTDSIPGEVVTVSPTRELSGPLNMLAVAVCLILSVGHLYLALFPVIRSSSAMSFTSQASRFWRHCSIR